MHQGINNPNPSNTVKETVLALKNRKDIVMKENRIFVGAVMIGILIAFLFGCSPHRRYDVLTIFFTGVPPPEGKKNKIRVEEKKVAKESQDKRKVASKSAIFSHAPYTQQQCDQCHKKIMSSTFKKKGEVPGSEVLPSKDVCLECHPNKSPSWAFTEGLWIHAPASQSNCNLCHSPHQSTIPARLTEKINKLCIQCHSEGYRKNTPAHVNATECLSCHNPHLGNNTLLLKKDYDEIRSRYLAKISHKH